MLRKTTLREVKILRMLRHPNIVSLTEAFRRKGEFINRETIIELNGQKDSIEEKMYEAWATSV